MQDWRKIYEKSDGRYETFLNRALGVHTRSFRICSPNPRPRLKNGAKRHLAFLIFEELYGKEAKDSLAISIKCGKRPDPHIEEMLNNTYMICHYTLSHDRNKQYQLHFHRALLDGLGYLPAPKWWRVRRKLLLSNY